MENLTVYRIECEYSNVNDANNVKQFCFTHITAEPIESHYNYIINIICNNSKLTIKDIKENCYFDMQIFEVGKVKI